MHFTIFYAWQSDRPEKVNKYFIRDAVNDAIKAIRADADLELAPSLDHDTKGVPGIPDIPSTICDKIDRCGIFLADMTFSGVTVPTDDKEAKHLPNPNVLIELGYALARVGPSRIIYVMNTAFGPPAQLPFDIRVRRHPIGYDLLSAKTSGHTEVRRTLARALEDAIRTVVESGVLAGQENGAGSETRRQSLEWRKQCADKLWAATLALRAATPKAFFDLDVITEAEYSDVVKSNRVVRTHIQEITDETIAAGIFFRGASPNANIETIRPILGESLWQRFSSYQAFLGRACFVLMGKFGMGGPWYKDHVALRLLAQVLTPEQVVQMQDMELAKMSFAREQAETAILAQIRAMLPDGTVPR